MGIGTDNPAGRLNIVNGSGLSTILDGNQVIFDRDNSLSYISQKGIGRSLAIRTSNSAEFDTMAMSIISNGNVGIGTATPTDKLDIQAENANARIALHTHATSGASSGVFGYRARGTATAPLAMDNNSSTTLFSMQGWGYDGDSYERAAMISFTVDDTVTDSKVPGKIIFATEDSNGEWSERMRISNDGGVRIGTGSATPQTKLEVSGNLKIGNDEDTCDANHIGSMRYKADAIEIDDTNTAGVDESRGDFQGCIKSGDTEYIWKSITGVVE